jgi:hypothetical protein
LILLKIIDKLILKLYFPLVKTTKSKLKKTSDEKEYRRKSPGSRIHSVKDKDRELNMADNGGTRLGTDRRKFQYTACIPEKRSGRDRRKGFDRRSPIARRRKSERRVSLTRQELFPKERIKAFKTTN